MHAGSTVDPFSTALDFRDVPEGPGLGARRRARSLGLEFGGPVGILAPDEAGGWAWAAREGAEPCRWPDPSRAAMTAAEVGGDGGDATLWLAGPAEDHVWMILRLPEGEGSGTAWVGFGLPGPCDRSGGRPWGPAVPAPALLAWGREVVARLRSESGPGAGGAGTPPSAERRRYRMPERLTREMQVSEPPPQYQRMAAETLREALGVEAVAWVPRSRREPVVVAGSVAGMAAEAFRLLPAGRPERPEATADAGAWWGTPGIRQAMTVAPGPDGGRAGWLVAVNPTDGRVFGPDEADLLRPAAGLIATQRTNARHYSELKDLLFGIIRSLTAAIDAKDPYTLGHSERVGRIAVELGEALGLSPNERGDLYLCGLLHDIGKIGISDAVLQKPGPLTAEEFREIKRHPGIGVQILSDLKKLNHLLPGVAHHHENYDGSGYPEGLSGHAIPRIARILAVADAFDAMSSTRPYRRRLGAEQIDRIFREGSGAQWDPEVVEAMFACRQKIESIRQKGLGQSVVQAVDDTIERGRDASYVSDSMMGYAGA